MNFSRPISRRETPWDLSLLSTLVWVAMPAWSVPTIHLVETPRIRS